MINRSHLNDWQISRRKAEKRGFAAIADMLAVLAIIWAGWLVLSGFGALKPSNTPTFDKIAAGTLKEGDTGQMTPTEMKIIMQHFLKLS